MEAKNFKVFREVENRPYNINIVGLRNRFARTNYYDDTIAVVYEKEGEWVRHFYEATTLPGSPSLLKPVNVNGTAILVPGQYEHGYRIGKHKGKYEALIQAGDVKVYRDKDLDLVYDINESSIEEGFFGINIHRASFGAKLVGPDSAGCQVIKKSEDFKEFMGLCNKAVNFWGDRLTYTLLEV